jgi:hypothetical protein
MLEPDLHPFKVAILWRGDAQSRADARPETSRLKAVFDALERNGITAEPAVWSEALTNEVRPQLMGVDAVLVWVNPVEATTGERRGALDELLREVAEAGVFVSTHPDVTAKMGVKAVLYRTRELGWGTETHLYETQAAFMAEFPHRLALGPRVLKRNRGNGGIGIWKIERATDADVLVMEAQGGNDVLIMPLERLMSERAADFADAGMLIDQPFQPRHLEGMIRCYLSGDRVAGFGHQLVRALAPPEAGPAGPRLYSGPDDPRFQSLRTLVERDWTPGMARLLSIDLDNLPVIWDADFLLGPKTPTGEDTYVLCEINVSSVFPIPEEAPEALARMTLKRLIAVCNRRTRWDKPQPQTSP